MIRNVAAYIGVMHIRGYNQWRCVPLAQCRPPAHRRFAWADIAAAANRTGGCPLYVNDGF